MSTYDAGTLVRVTASFRDSGGTLADTTAACTVEKPNGTTATPAVVHDSTGTYHADIDTTGGPMGTWVYRWAGTGALQADAHGSFFVYSPGF